MKLKLITTLLFCLLMSYDSEADSYGLVSESQTAGRPVWLNYSSCWSSPFLQNGETFEIRQTGNLIQFIGLYLGGGGVTICPGGQYMTYSYDLGEFAEGEYQLEIYRLFTFDGVTPIIIDFNNLPPVNEVIAFSVLGAPAAVPSVNHLGIMLLLVLTLLIAYLFRRRLA